MNNYFNGNLVKTNRIIYTSSSFAKQNLIYLQEVGILEAQKPHIKKRTNLKSYLFFIVLDGTGVLNYNGTKYTLEKGNCVFIDCSKPYSQYSSKNLWSLIWIHFYGNNINELYKQYLNLGNKPCFIAKNPELYIKKINTIYEIASNKSYISDIKIYENIISIISLATQERYNTINKSAKSLRLNILNIKNYLEDNFQNKISLDELAKKFFVNKFYLSRIFKDEFGTSINNYIISLKITKAKELLRFSQKSIEEIAFEVGIGDPNYFSRLFKKLEGMSPSEFKQQW